MYQPLMELKKTKQSKAHFPRPGVTSLLLCSIRIASISHPFFRKTTIQMSNLIFLPLIMSLGKFLATCQQHINATAYASENK